MVSSRAHLSRVALLLPLLAAPTACYEPSLSDALLCGRAAATADGGDGADGADGGDAPDPGVCPDGLTCVVDRCLSSSFVARFDACAAPPPLLGSVAGLTFGPSRQGAQSCGRSSSEGSEAAFSFAVSDGRFVELTFSTDSPGTAFDTVIYVREGDCLAGVERACDDDGGLLAGRSRAALEAPTPGDYFVIVDGAGPVGGRFELLVRGTIRAGFPCVVGEPDFVCEPGTSCIAPADGAGRCEAVATPLFPPAPLR